MCNYPQKTSVLISQLAAPLFVYWLWFIFRNSPIISLFDYYFQQHERNCLWLPYYSIITINEARRAPQPQKLHEKRPHLSEENSARSIKIVRTNSILCSGLGPADFFLSPINIYFVCFKRNPSLSVNIFYVYRQYHYSYREAYLISPVFL